MSPFDDIPMAPGAQPRKDFEPMADGLQVPDDPTETPEPMTPH